jgi:tetratricopeptide (TPR) repeat protein
MKASLILSVMEEEVQKQALIRKEPAVYIFKNIKKRDEWRQRLSYDERSLYHKNITAIFVRELPDDDSKSLSIAYHLLQIPNDWRGCQWLVRAGDIYVRSFSAEKAIVCYEKVLNDLSVQRGDTEDWLFVKAAIGHSNVSLSRINAQKAISQLQEARRRAQRLNKPSYEALLEMHIAKYERLGSELDNALKRFKRALTRMEKLNDPEMADATTSFTAYFLFWQGRFKDVVNIYEQSVPDIEKYPIGPFSIIAALMVGLSYVMVGRITQGLGLLDTIHRYCLQKGDRYLTAYAGSVLAMAMLSINRVEDALRYLKSSIKDAEESLNYRVEVDVALLLAIVHYVQGDVTQSIDYLQRFLKHGRETSLNSLLPYYMLQVCWAIETKQLYPVQGFSLEQEIDRVIKARNIFIRGIAHRYQALLGKSQGIPDKEITRLFTLAIRLIKECGNQIELARTHLEMARHYSTTKKNRKAKETMQVVSKILSSANIEMIPDDLRTLVEDHNFESTILAEILHLTKEMASRKENKKLLQQIVAAVNRLTGAERALSCL